MAIERFDRSESVDLSIQRDRGKMPEAAAKYFTFKTLSHGVTQAPQAGEINFYRSLGNDGLKMLSAYAENQCVNEANELAGGVSLKLEQECKQYEAESRDGQGYAQFKVEKYKELYGEAIGMASTPRTAEIMQRYQSAGLRDMSVMAVREEFEMRKSDALLRTEEGREVLLHKVELSPALQESLRLEYSSLIESLQPMLGRDFPAYQRNALMGFEKSALRGEIKQDPYEALKSLEKDPRGLTTADVHGLQKEAYAAIDHVERSLQEQANMRGEIAKRKITELKIDIEHAARQGENARGMLERAFTDMNFTEQEKKELELWLDKSDSMRNNEAQKEAAIRNCIISRDVVPGEITAGDIENVLFKDFEALRQEKEGAGQPSPTLVDKMFLVKQAPNVYNRYPLGRLQYELEHAAMYSDNATNCLDACVAIAGNSGMRALQGLSPETVAFASLAVRTASVSPKQEGAVLTLRKLWEASIPADELKRRGNDWKREVLHNTKSEEKFIKGALSSVGITTEWWRLWSSIPSTVRESEKRDMLEVGKMVYQRTGSLTQAQYAAASHVQRNYSLSDINGKEQYMYNPPSEENVGLPMPVIRGIIAEKCNAVVDDIAAQGDDYLGFIKVKRSGKKDSRIVSAFINNKWQNRKVHVESSGDEKTYSAYILHDEGKDVKEYLLTPATGQRAIIKFR